MESPEDAGSAPPWPMSERAWVYFKLIRETLEERDLYQRAFDLIIDLTASRCEQLEVVANELGPAPKPGEASQVVEFHPLYAQRQEAADHLFALLEECCLSLEDFEGAVVPGVDADENAFEQLRRIGKRIA